MTLPLILFHNQGRGSPVGGGISYTNKVLGIDLANLIGYWPMNEAAGTDALDASPESNDGTYNSDVSGWPPGTGIGDGNTAPTFDGTNDYNDLETAAIFADFDGDHGTVAM